MSTGSTFSPDVVVIGAGPTGLTTALFLGLRGVRTLVVERNATTSDEPRAVSLADESLRMLDQIGVLEALAPEVMFDIGNRYYGVGDRLLAEVRALPSPQGYPAKSVFDQPFLEEVLAGAAAERENIEVRFDTEARIVSIDPAVVELTGPAGVETLRPQWIIGCDGGRSETRKALGYELKGSTQKHRWVCYDVLEEPARERFAEMRCNGIRPFVVAPGEKDRCRYEFMLLPDDDLDEMVSFEKVRELLAPYRDLTPEQLRRARVYVAQERIAEHLTKGRVTLAGDAYHLMPPFAGQGLNAGVRDAANVAWKVAAMVHRRANTTLIDTYEQERRPHAEQMVRLSVRLGKVIMATGRRRTQLRDALIRALRIIPPVNDYVTQMRFMRPAAFAAGVVVPAGDDVSKTLRELVGRSVPNLPVGEGRLDAHLGTGWALLTTVAADRVPAAVREIAELVEAPVLAVGEQPGALRPAGPAGWLTEATRPTYVLVRPDRYVAAAFTDAGVAAVDRMLRTWFVAPSAANGETLSGGEKQHA